MVSNLIEQLYRDESYRQQPYLDCCGKYWRECTCQVKGKLTAGVGRNLDDVGIRRDEATVMLQNDVTRASADVLRTLPWAANLDLVRRAALTALVFNMGIGGLLKFKHMLDAIQAGKWQEASDAALNSLWAQQVGARATRLAEQIKTGTWQ